MTCENSVPRAATEETKMDVNVTQKIMRDEETFERWSTDITFLVGLLVY